MTDRPIIFSGQMVRALLEGRKTMTRRLATSPLRQCEVGDRLWVRESLCQRRGEFLGIKQNVINACYAADEAEVLDRYEFNLLPWWKGFGDLPSIHMPRSVSRLTLIVTGAKVESLHTISDDDCLAEGVSEQDVGPTPRMKFFHIWRKLHGSDSWFENPDVVALSFRVETINIDRVAA